MHEVESPKKIDAYVDMFGYTFSSETPNIHKFIHLFLQVIMIDILLWIIGIGRIESAGSDRRIIRS